MSPFADLEGGPFGCIVADPPWHFRARTAVQSQNWNSPRHVERHYDTMSMADIITLPVSEVAAKDAHLFLWVTGPCLRQAFDVMEAWGFRYAHRNAKDVREIILSPVREHSRKPDEAIARIERYCDGPYLELFARQERAGWKSWGLETDKFTAAAA